MHCIDNYIERTVQYYRPNERYNIVKLAKAHERATMIKLYGHEISGNSYKARLLLSLLNLEYEWIKIDLLKGEQKSPEYLAMNPFGQVPLLIDGETQVADAQAILVYLARQYGGDRWLPLDAIPLSQVVRWLSTTAGAVRQGVENARLYHLFGAATNINIDRATQKSAFILTQLNQHLSTHTWLEFDRPTIADIAVFPYVALARDGKIDLDPYPHVLAWIDRIKQLPGYIPMAGV
jgi:glutathione S-transferase